MTAPRLIARGAALASVLLAWAAAPARADLTIQVLNATAPPGGAGSFDVVLENTTGSFQVAGFSIELSVPTPSGVKFAGVNTSTTAAPYLFGTLQSPPFSFDTFPNTTFSATDTDMTAPGFVTVGPNAEFGLAHVTFSVAPGTATGPVTVSLVGAGTSLSDVNGGAIRFSPANGTITVATVPEPSAFALAGLGAVASLAYARRRRAGRP